MRKATKFFILLGIISGILYLFLGALVSFAGIEDLPAESGYTTLVMGLIMTLVSFGSLKHFNKAGTKDELKMGWKIATLLFVNLIAGILMFCLKEEDFPNYEDSYSTSYSADSYSSEPSASYSGGSNLDELSSRLAKLKEQFDNGSISQSEYERQRDALYDRYM